MYPKVKVRVQRDEAERYAFEKTSLESLKAFEWLSLNNSSSSDESPVSVARIPRCYVPMSPPPSFHTSEEQTHKKKSATDDSRKTARATSAPRPRAVLSSPDNDVIVTKKKAQPRRATPSGLENHNRHTQCKIFPKSTIDSFSLAHGYSKELTDPKSSIRPKTRAALVDSAKSKAILVNTNKRTTQQKKAAPPSPNRS